MSCLQEWLSQVRFTMIDLISDYGGNELFVIDGDALIFFFANNHFNIDKPSSLLELVYLIEKFLDDLITRKASFVIAFFDCNENALTLNSPKRKFYRNAIKNHFSTTEIEVISFPSWLDDSWLYYVKEIHPVFIMVVSGDLESGSSIDNWKAFAHSSLSRGLNCALLSTDFYFKDRFFILTQQCHGIHIFK